MCDKEVWALLSQETRDQRWIAVSGLPAAGARRAHPLAAVLSLPTAVATGQVWGPPACAQVVRHTVPPPIRKVV